MAFLHQKRILKLQHLFILCHVQLADSSMLRSQRQRKARTKPPSILHLVHHILPPTPQRRKIHVCNLPNPPLQRRRRPPLHNGAPRTHHAPLEITQGTSNLTPAIRIHSLKSPLACRPRNIHLFIMCTHLRPRDVLRRAVGGVPCVGVGTATGGCERMD